MFWTYRWWLNSSEIVRTNMKRLCGYAVSYIVAHYCATSHRVAWSGVSLSVALSLCHTSEPYKKRLNRSSYHFCSRIGWAQWTTYYMRSRCQHGKGQFWGRNRQTIVNYRDTPRSCVQRQVNLSRCRLNCGLAWAESITLHGRSRYPGAILVNRVTHCKV